MAFRRNAGIKRASTLLELYELNKEDKSLDTHHNRRRSDGAGSPSLAARAIGPSALDPNPCLLPPSRAIRASALDPNPSLLSPSSSPSASSSPFLLPAASKLSSSSSVSASASSLRLPPTFPDKGGCPSGKDNKETTSGFWGIVASKAKSILQEDDDFNTPLAIHPSSSDIIQQPLDKTEDILEETRKIQIRTRTNTQDDPTQIQNNSWQRRVLQPVGTNSLPHQQTQLKASRDVAMATAVKAKVLLRELKTVKADLAFAKQRCSQLEEENKRHRESREKGENPADDDLIRLQLETLLAEKARLAHENSVYARENRFLREIVEYKQLRMQDVVCLDDDGDEAADAYPLYVGDMEVCSTPTTPVSPNFFKEMSFLNFTLPLEMKEDVRNKKTSKLSQSTSREEMEESGSKRGDFLG